TMRDVRQVGVKNTFRLLFGQLLERANVVWLRHQNFLNLVVAASPEHAAIQITAWNDVTVAFGGSQAFGNQELSIGGSIDRVTGDVEATDLSMDTKTHSTVSSLQYALKCRPTQRMF